MTLIGIVKISKDVPVFLPGEYVPIKVTITNSGENEIISWACVQLLLEIFPGKGVKKSERFEKRSKHIGEPQVLFCDIEVNKNETQSFNAQLLIPNDIKIIPSFTGTYVVYEYSISIAIQPHKNDLKITKLSFELMNYPFEIPQKKSEDCQSELFIDNDCDHGEKHFREIVADLVDDFCFKPSGKSFKIDDPKGVICHIDMPKMNFKFGELIVGKLKFPQKQGSYCIEYLVRLECVERIKKGFGSLDSKECVVPLKTDYGVCSQYSSVAFQLPLDTGNNLCFHTEFLSISYRLHFEFVTSDFPATVEKAYNTLGAANSLKVESVEWNLPINVIGPPTHNAALFAHNDFFNREDKIILVD
ncbi:Retrograde Golgi transport protein RGP1 homolog [Strongyloides ratti]|uniref:Retrograde Golgi transport protein RGP1 homolog n=1 Tax=Strongyloides ratti TaxID=34506 RepID=A0A090MXJ9_STRRB|nr:Retrograde Golgi transport protein RGP1 homolog [Strongyloides ratti]CEF65564.1 Retrograde Golgi transport protein RGP1 homolog [Strongyloides ratti]